jgi:tetratricopeptide (TPR) repeat protein
VSSTARTTRTPLRLGLCLIGAAALTACGGGQKPAPSAGGPAAQETGDPAQPAAPPPVAKEAKELFTDGGKAYGSGDKARAEQLMKSAFDADEKFALAAFNVGVLREEAGDLEGARSWYEKAAQANPKFGDAHINLGRLHAQAGRTNEAFRAVQQAVNVEPLNGEANLNIAQQAKRNRDFPKAVGSVRKALTEDSQNVKAYEVLAQVYYDLGRFELAKLVCVSAIPIGKETNPASLAGIYNMLGLVHLKLDDVTRALAAFRDATKSDPKYVPALINQGSITFNYRDYEASLQAFDKALAVEPKNTDALLNRAVAARALKRFDEAEKGYRDVIAIDERNAAAWFNLGVLFQEHMQKLEDAVKAYESVLRFSQDADLRKDASERIKQVRIMIQAMKEAEEMMKEQEQEEQQAPPSEEGAGAEGGEG